MYPIAHKLLNNKYIFIYDILVWERTENVQSYQTNLKHDVYKIQLNFLKLGFVRDFYHINVFIKMFNETSVAK